MEGLIWKVQMCRVQNWQSFSKFLEELLSYIKNYTVYSQSHLDFINFSKVSTKILAFLYKIFKILEAFGLCPSVPFIWDPPISKLDEKHRSYTQKKTLLDKIKVSCTCQVMKIAYIFTQQSRPNDLHAEVVWYELSNVP